MKDTTKCMAVDAGRMGYTPALELQNGLRTKVADGLRPSVLLLLEHPHVYTLGRRGSLADILAGADELSRLGVEVHHTDRGGQVTYHGPGQLVGYPIVDLRTIGIGPLKYVRMLEEVIVATLSEFGISAGTGERPTGVWVGDSKIAAIGVKVSRGVTTHGFALNVDPDLSYFDNIVPCGMPQRLVTSMASLRPHVTGVESVIPVLARHFGRVFGFTIEWTDVEEVTRHVSPAASTRT
jgi:lipoate-protein ligase B